MTIADVRELTEQDITAARRDPDFYPDHMKQAKTLVERMHRVSVPISGDSNAYAAELIQRGWITAHTWSVANRCAA